MVQYGNAASFTVQLEGPFGTVEATPVKYGSITLPVAGWKNETSPFWQAVTVNDVSVASKIDLTADRTQTKELWAQGMAFIAENIDGNVTVWCYGNKPKDDLTLRATVTEVLVTDTPESEEQRVAGALLGNAAPQADWDQDDPAKHDYIKNKPDLLLNSGGTITGNLSVGRTDDETQRNLYVRRSINDSTRSFRIYWGDSDVLRADAAYGGTVENYMELQSDETAFKRAVNIASGGTGATKASDALENLGGLPKSGGTMSGPIDMGSEKITNLAAPANNADAATKLYVDGKRLSSATAGTVTLTTSWTNGEQEVSVSDILASDMPHWGIVYGTNKAAEKEAFALIDELETQAGKFFFRCFGDVPTIPLTIQWEVNR